MKKAVCLYKIKPLKGVFGLVSLLCFAMLLSLQSCSPKISEKGKASFYADFFQGRKTSNGEVFRQRKRTAAHKTLPFGTKVKVKNLKNGKTVTVRINDRGPFVEGRIIDLSKKAARKLGMVNDGVVQVEIKYKKAKR
jgi:rare lipoprotein A